MKKLPVLEGKATVVMTVKGSPITIEVDGTNAQITAGNFVDLVQRVCMTMMFHRVATATFVVQGRSAEQRPELPTTEFGNRRFY